MSTPQEYKLSPSEVLALWNTYLTHTMTRYVTKYFIQHTDDQELLAVLEMTLKQSIEGMEKSRSFMEQAGHPLPQGFDERDVNFEAPRIYSDNLILMIKSKLAQDAGVVLALSVASASRSDIRSFYNKALKGCADLVAAYDELIHKRGLRHPELHIPVPETIEKVHSKSFIGGIFDGKRPLSIAEIFHISASFHSTGLVSVFFKSFAQVTTSKEFRQFYQQGAELMDKQLESFQGHLTENKLPKLPTWENEITDTTVSPLSERLMLFKSAILIAATAGRYGVALSTVLRKDIGVEFMRLMTETLAFGQESIDLMIKHGYLDQHPLAEESDRT